MYSKPVRVLLGICDEGPMEPPGTASLLSSPELESPLLAYTCFG